MQCEGVDMRVMGRRSGCESAQSAKRPLALQTRSDRGCACLVGSVQVCVKKGREEKTFSTQDRRGSKECKIQRLLVEYKDSGAEVQEAHVTVC